jgi:predicted TIM-barrel fold metal-dependent hydrolase
MDRYVVISSDCHAVGRPEDFEPYFAARHLDAYREYWRGQAAAEAAARKGTEDGGRLFSKEAMDEFHQFEAVDEATVGGTPGLWDSARRMKELEADGVVAEVLFANGAPFMRGFGVTDATFELHAAGLDAYNRWLADFCASTPGRRAGVALTQIYDVDVAVRTVESAAALGLKGLSVPILFDDPGAPPLYHDRYEPLWAACAATGLPVHIHGGPGPDYGVGGMLGIMLYTTEVPLWSRRQFYFFVWSGALERHPTMQVVFTEGTCDWVPGTLAYLDFLYDSKMFAQIRSELPVRPSDYWNRQCYVGTSSMSRAETDMRHSIGVDRMMFGSDYPHLEGTWPRTLQWLQATIGGIPADEARMILGENAARLYGFDMQSLSALAARVGPSEAELAERVEVPGLAKSQVDRPGAVSVLG